MYTIEYKMKVKVAGGFETRSGKLVSEDDELPSVISGIMASKDSIETLSVKKKDRPVVIGDK